MSATRYLLPPEPFSQRQRIVLWSAAIVVAITRIWALSVSMWEWDEGLFTLAVREYDVVNHRPHPPGFPLFIAAAKLVRLVIANDFRALQMVTLAGALFLFPATFFLARELRFSFSTSLLGALLYGFAPNVWYYGGTGFSDVPATTLVIAACALLLRGCRDGRSYVVGAFVFALSLGFRPQLLLCGLFPLSLATFLQWRQSRRVVTAGLAAIGVVVAASYAGSAIASGPRVTAFVEAVVGQSRYVTTVDSFLNPGRPIPQRLVRSFFLRAIRGPRVPAFFIAAFCGIAVIAAIRRRDASPFLLIAIFAPLNVVSWLLLDIGAASRYATAYAAMYAILVASGAGVVATGTRSTRASALVQAVLVIAVIAGLMTWSVPGIQRVRTQPSPPGAAMEWLLEKAPASTSRIHVQEGLGPVADCYLPGYDIAYFPPGREYPRVTFDRRHYYVRDERSSLPGAVNFSYPLRPLVEIARARFFDVSVVSLEDLTRFGSGWFDVESHEGTAWRWMGARSALTLAPLDGPATLGLEFQATHGTAGTSPVVTIGFNGEVVVRHAVTPGPNRISVSVTPRPGGWNEAIIEIDRTFIPPGDSRELGLQLFSWGWSPVAAAAGTR